jgi:hypothetical protein
MYSFTSEFIKQIQQAEDVLQIQPGEQFSKDLFDACIRMAERGIAIELYLDNRHIHFLEENPYVLNACIQLITKGACVFSVASGQQSATNFMLDFRRYGWSTADKLHFEADQSIETMEFQRMLILFDTLKKQSSSYLIRKDDIQIDYTLSNDTILSGDSIELTWQIKNASKVIIQGLGEVNAFGRTYIKPEQDTIIKIGAYNKQQVQLKAFMVRVADIRENLQYDIGFIDEHTKEYTSLVNSDLHPHVYGVSKGHRMRLHWQITKAQEVHISPFNKKNTSGIIEFIPTESMTIEIQAVFNATTFVRNIQILLFPIPVLSNPVMPIDVLTQTRFSLPKPKGFSAHAQSVKQAEQERYQSLNNSLTSYAKKLRTSDRTFLQLTKDVFVRLKNTYASRTEIVEELKSIESYYEHRHNKNGISK